MCAPKIPRACRLAGLLVVACLGAGAAQAADSDIVITEIMQNPAVLGDTEGEWFEIHNTGPDPVDLNGWTIRDDGIDSHVIAAGGPLVIAAGAYAVLGRNATAMATQGVTLLYEYASFNLANADDEVVLVNVGMVEIDRVMYDGGVLWPDPNGASMMWVETTADNSVGANWTTSTAPFGGGDLGTPGAPNGAVAPQPPTVTDVIHRPLLPVPGEAVTVTADAGDSDGTVTGVTLWVQRNGGGFTATAMSAAGGDSWSGTIAAGLLGDAVDYYVEAEDNDGLTGTNPADAPASSYSYSVQNETITPIAAIHADSLLYDGARVMVQGQVYIPGDYRADGVSVSAYIQDGSGRGLNVFGTAFSTGMDLLNDTSAVVKVSGTVDWYNVTTVEILNYEVELVSTGNPALEPLVLGTAAAAGPANEGTYIESAGPITAIATTGGSNPAHNVTIDDGSGPVIVRIDDDVVPGVTGWLVGDQVTAAGAGATYAGDGEIIVGLASDVVNSGQGPDVTPPVLLGATLTAATTVTLQFDEAIDATTGGTVANYQVYETTTPANTIAVLAAAVQADPAVVVLTLAASAAGVSHTVAVANVTDLAGNPIAPGTTALIVDPGTAPPIVITEIMQNPNALLDSDGEWFEVYNAGASPVDMNGWVIRDVDLDSHVIDNGSPLVINPGEYKVLGINAAAMAGEGVTVFYQYAGIALANGADELILETTAAVVVDSVAWDDGVTFPDPTGKSMQWDGNGDNADGANWKDTGPVFGSGDRGTPGRVNDVVSPAPLPGPATALQPNYPNPFNPATLLAFSLAEPGRVTLRIYDLRGRLVRTVLDERLEAGVYDGTYRWNGLDAAGQAVPSGAYFCRLATEAGPVLTRKMTLLR